MNGCSCLHPPSSSCCHFKEAREHSIDEREPERGGLRNFIQEKNNVSDFNNDRGEGENNRTKKHLKLPRGNKLDAQLTV